MVSVDLSLFAQIINFILLVWVMNIVLYRPIRKVLLQRKEKVSGLEQSVETFSGDAKDKETAFAEGIKAARAKGTAAKDALLEEASAEEKKMIGEINDRAKAEMDKVKAQIAGDADKVRASLAKEVDAFADSIAQKILGRAA